MTNLYLPLRLGPKLVYDGTKDRRSENVKVTVLSPTRTIVGIEMRDHQRPHAAGAVIIVCLTSAAWARATGVPESWGY